MIAVTFDLHRPPRTSGSGCVLHPFRGGRNRHPGFTVKLPGSGTNQSITPLVLHLVLTSASSVLHGGRMLQVQKNRKDTISGEKPSPRRPGAHSDGKIFSGARVLSAILPVCIYRSQAKL